jgi:hypothetical protein
MLPEADRIRLQHMLDAAPAPLDTDGLEGHA